jgi:hypothetical protein
MGMPAGAESKRRISAIRLYLDEDSMRRSLVFGLRARGVDVLAASEAGTINRSDEDRLERTTWAVIVCSTRSGWRNGGLTRGLSSARSSATPWARSFGVWRG